MAWARQVMSTVLLSATSLDCFRYSAILGVLLFAYSHIYVSMMSRRCASRVVDLRVLHNVYILGTPYNPDASKWSSSDLSYLLSFIFHRGDLPYMCKGTGYERSAKTTARLGKASSWLLTNPARARDHKETQRGAPLSTNCRDKKSRVALTVSAPRA